MEAVVERRGTLAQHGPRPRPLGHLVERPLLTLGRALDHDELAGLDRVEGAGDDLARLLGRLGADLPELGDVEMERARAHRGRDPNRGVVAESQGIGTVLHGRHRTPEALVEPVVGEIDLVPEDDLRVLELVGDDAGAGVGGEHAGIEVDQAAEGREPELAGLQDQVEGVDLVQELQLGRVRHELGRLPRLVGDPVQVRQPPARVEGLVAPNPDRGACGHGSQSLP